jgi:hypothetical protein
MNLISGTNAWYNIAEGLLDPVILKQDGRRLFATPINLLELASGLSERSLVQRRNAAKAVLDHADQIAVDTDTHLARIWGLNPIDLSIDWRNGFMAIADATSLVQITRGVNDFREGVVRRVNVSLAQAWKTYHWGNFMNEIEDAIDSDLPGYKETRRAGRIVHMNQVVGGQFERKILSPEFRHSLLIGTYIRALLVVGERTVRPTAKQMDKANALLQPYLDAYSRYIVKCARVFAPHPNDWGDLESFLYLQGENRLLTEDQR